ncbi:hypothetical protein ACFCYF_41850 [Streptomyces chartreusis]|uniref:hypothetical protein n=1 Tax=Streptomyces chartreusis TaxID=1969 RepID=UPI0035D75E50
MRALQYLLSHRGLNVFPHGEFDTATQQAVDAVGQEVGKPAGGTTDRQIWFRLVTDVWPGQSDDQVRAVQTLLISVGCLFEETGVFDAATTAALDAFDFGFSTGRGSALVDDRTWESLLEAQPLKEVLGAVAQHTSEVRTSAREHRDWLLHEPDAKLPDYLPLIADARWDELEQKATDHLAESLGLLRAIAASAAPSVQALAAVQTALRYARVPALSLSMQPGWEARRGQVIQELRGWMSEQEAASRIDELVGLRAKEELEKLEKHLSTGLTRREQVFRRRLATLSGACLAQAVARFHRALGATQVQDPVDPADLLEGERSLRDGEEALRVTLGTGSHHRYDAAKLSEAATALQGAAGVVLRDAPVLAAQLVKARAAKPSEPAASLMDAMDLIQRGIADTALAGYIMWLTQLPVARDPLYSWMTESARPLETVRQPSVSLAQIVADPGSFKSAPVTVEGVLSDVKRIRILQAVPGVEAFVSDGAHRVRVRCRGRLLGQEYVTGTPCRLTADVTTIPEPLLTVVANPPVSDTDLQASSFLDFARSRLRDVHLRAPNVTGYTKNGWAFSLSWGSGIDAGAFLLASGSWFEGVDRHG